MVTATHFASEAFTVAVPCRRWGGHRTAGCGLGNLDWPRPSTRDRRLPRRMIGTAATHRCWGGHRAVGTLRLGHDRQRRGAVGTAQAPRGRAMWRLAGLGGAASRGGRRLTGCTRPATARTVAVCNCLKARAESGRCDGAVPARPAPPRPATRGRLGQREATAVGHLSAGRTHSWRLAPCARSTPRCSTGNPGAAPMTTQHVAL